MADGNTASPGNGQQADIMKRTIKDSDDTILRQLPESFCRINIHDVTALDVQAEIDRIAKTSTPKTVRNYHGFISAVLGTFCPNLKICTPLPQKTKNEPYIPSGDDIKRILECADLKSAP